MAGHTAAVTYAEFSPDGKQVVSSSLDKTVRIWDVETGLERRKFNSSAEKVTFASFSPDGSLVVSSSGNSVRVLSVATGKEILNLQHSFRVTSATFNHDGTKLLASMDGNFQVWDVQTGKVLARSKPQIGVHTPNEVDKGQSETGDSPSKPTGGQGDMSAKFSPDGTKVVSADSNNFVTIWDAETGEEVARLEGHSGTVSSVSFSPDGKKVVSSSVDQTVRIWDVETSSELKVLESSKPVLNARFGPDFNILTSSSDFVQLWPPFSAVTPEPTARPTDSPSFPTKSPTSLSPTASPISKAASRVAVLRFRGSLGNQVLEAKPLLLSNLRESFGFSDFVDIDHLETQPDGTVSVHLSNMNAAESSVLAENPSAIKQAIPEAIQQDDLEVDVFRTKGLSVSFANITTLGSTKEENVVLAGSVNKFTDLGPEAEKFLDIATPDSKLSFLFAETEHNFMSKPKRRLLESLTSEQKLANIISVRIGFYMAIRTTIKMQYQEGTSSHLHVWWPGLTSALQVETIICQNCSVLQVSSLDQDEKESHFLVEVESEPNVGAYFQIPAAATHDVKTGLGCGPASYNFLVDTIPPSVDFVLVGADSGNVWSRSGNATVTIHFSEAIQPLLQLSHFQIKNAILGSVKIALGQNRSLEETVYNLEVIPLSQGIVTISLLTSKISDLSGNNLEEGKFEFTFAPFGLGMVILPPPSPSFAIPLMFTLRFSERVEESSFDKRRVSVQNGEVFRFQSSAEECTIAIRPFAVGRVLLTVASGFAKSQRKQQTHDSISAHTKFDPCQRCFDHTLCILEGLLSKCTCPGGYLGDGMKCKPCPGSDYNCSGHGKCIENWDLDGPPICECDQGYSGLSCNLDSTMARPQQLEATLLNYSAVYVTWVLEQDTTFGVLGFQAVVSPGMQKYEFSQSARSAKLHSVPKGEFLTIQIETVTQHGNSLPSEVSIFTGPTVSSVSIKSASEHGPGSSQGGDRILIRGSDLVEQGSDATALLVRFTGSQNVCGSVEILSGTEISCEVPPGVGTNRPISVRSGGVIAHSPFPSALKYDYYPPTVKDYSLSLVEEADNPENSNVGNVTGIYESKDFLQIEGMNFGVVSSAVKVFLVGKFERKQCLVKKVNHNVIVCETPLGKGGPYQVEVQVLGRSAAPSQNWFFYPEPPSITALVSLIGCQQKGSRIIDCPTNGDVWIGVRGHNFGVQIGYLAIFVNSHRCLDHRLHNKSFAECLLPEGTGLNVPIQIRVAEQTSSIAHLLSFGKPAIHRVSGCLEQRGNVATECARSGNIKVTVEGKNFGRAKAMANVGIKECTQVEHDVHHPHEKLTCTLPPGRGIANVLYVIQHFGAFSYPSGKLDYDLCPPGTRYRSRSNSSCVACELGETSLLDSEQCMNCPFGHFGDSSPIETCEPCGLDLIQPSTGQTNCSQCPPGLFTSAFGQRECRTCPPGMYVRNSRCVFCPDGAVCLDGLIESQESFWLDKQAYVTHRCPPKFCAKGKCGRNRNGRLCGHCDDGYHVFGTNCVKCALKNRAWFLVPFVLNFLLVLVVFKSSDFMAPHAGLIKIFLYFSQSILLIFSPEDMRDELYMVLSFLSLSESVEGSESSGYCFQMGPHASVLIKLLLPVLSMAQLFLMFCFQFLFRGISNYNKGKTDPFYGFRTGAYQRASVTLFISGYYSLVANCSKLLRCIEVAGQNVVQTAPALDCDTTEYNELFLVAIVVLAATFVFLVNLVYTLAKVVFPLLSF